MVIQMERTQRGTINDALEALKRAHVNMVGFILTNTRHYEPHYYYDLYHGDKLQNTKEA